MKAKQLTFVMVLLGLICFKSYGHIGSTIFSDTSIVQVDDGFYPDINYALEDSIVGFAMQLLGTPYVPAGCGREGFDCSGFVNYVFNRFKVNVPRRSIEFEHIGREVSINEAQKGDILLFINPYQEVIGHVGIVTEPKGMESEFIHAASGRDRKVKISTISTKWYTWKLAKVIRVL